jgi:hypothetical protein
MSRYNWDEINRTVEDLTKRYNIAAVDSVTVGGNSDGVELTLTSLTPEQAEQIFRLIGLKQVELTVL